MLLFCLLAIPVLAAFSPAQPFDPALYQELRWRMIGPFRAGRTVAISGIPSQPAVFYMAVSYTHLTLPTILRV